MGSSHSVAILVTLGLAGKEFRQADVTRFRQWIALDVLVFVDDFDGYRVFLF